MKGEREGGREEEKVVEASGVLVFVCVWFVRAVCGEREKKRETKKEEMGFIDEENAAERRGAERGRRVAASKRLRLEWPLLWAWLENKRRHFTTNTECREKGSRFGCGKTSRRGQCMEGVTRRRQEEGGREGGRGGTFKEQKPHF